MGEMDYARYQLEFDHSSVMDQVRSFVFMRTQFEEMNSEDCISDYREKLWPKKPETLKEVLLFPLAFAVIALIRLALFVYRRFVVPWGKKQKVRIYAKRLREAVREWKKTEGWLKRPEVREIVLRAKVSDEEGEDPFFIAERLSRLLLENRRVFDEFESWARKRRIAMAALVLADIGFADYRDFEDPKQRRKRSRREF